MAEERDDQTKGRSTGAASQGDDDETGDPGRTPGTAEGDEQTVDEDLRQKERQGEV